jgi:Na+-transporting methylmalonyl-CoA/oxaloacetate decarboxylase gamma subunit
MFEDLSLGIALLGMGLVFAVIAFLMLFIMTLGWIMRMVEHVNSTRAAAAAPLPDPVAPLAERIRMDAMPPPGMVPAPGAMGEVDLHTVDDRTAALLMSIVADDLGCDPNQLTFVSIKEI